MILIISIKADYSTTQIINWLNFYVISYFPINEDNKIQATEIKNGEIVFGIKNQILKLSQITVVWYRRGNFSFEFEPTFAL